MNRDKAVVIFRLPKRKQEVDLEVPLNITANDLIIALNTAYSLGINTNDIQSCYIPAENPIVLLRGNRTLAEFGVRNGTVLEFTRE